MITQAAGSVGSAKQRWHPRMKKNGAKVHRWRDLKTMRKSNAADDDEKL